MSRRPVWWRGRIVGNFDTETKTYYKILDYRLDQIFKIKKYNYAVGISKGLVQFLIITYGEIRWFMWVILNLPDSDPFEASISFNDFMELKENYHFSTKNADPQFVLSLYKGWTWRYMTQKILN